MQVFTNNAETIANIGARKNAVAFLSMLGRALKSCLLAGALLVAGCSSQRLGESTLTLAPQKAVITAGTWVGNLDKATITLSLSKDGRFQTVFRGGKLRSVVKGKARIDGSYVRLEPTEFDGDKPRLASQREQVKFKFSSDWATLTSESGVSLARKI